MSVKRRYRVGGAFGGFAPVSAELPRPQDICGKRNTDSGFGAVAHQEAGALAAALDAVVFVVERAVGEAEAAATDTAVEFVAQGCHLCDAGVEFRAEERGEVFPVSFGRGAFVGKAGQGSADFCDGKPHALSDHHKAEAADIGAGVAALPRVGAIGEHQTLFLIVADGGDREAGAVGDLTNGKAGRAEAYRFLHGMLFSLPIFWLS